MKKKKPQYIPSPIYMTNMEYGVCNKEAKKIRSFRTIRDLIIIIIAIIIILIF